TIGNLEGKNEGTVYKLEFYLYTPYKEDKYQLVDIQGFDMEVVRNYKRIGQLPTRMNGEFSDNFFINFNKPWDKDIKKSIRIAEKELKREKKDYKVIRSYKEQRNLKYRQCMYNETIQYYK